VTVAGTVADAVARALAEGQVPIVLGGDCTVTLGVMAGLQRHDPGAGLLYFDGDADLATPQTTGSGVLDAMGVAHLLGLADNPLARLGPRWPMLTDARLVLFGYDETDPETYQVSVLNDRPGLARFPYRQVRAPTRRAAPPEHWRRSPRRPMRSWCTSMSTPWTHATSRWPTSRTTGRGCRSPWPPRS